MTAPAPADVLVGWVPLTTVAVLRDAAPAPIRVELCGRPWALIELDGEPAALADVCPHRRVPLSAGRAAAGPGGVAVLECGYHGWSYDRTGRCARIPALGEDVVPRGMGSVEVLATAVRGGVVWGCPDPDPGPAPELGDEVVALPEHLLEIDVPTLDAALGATGANGGVRTGADRFGDLQVALRPLGGRRTALVPLVTTARPDEATTWSARIDALPFPPYPTPTTDHQE